MLRCYGYFSWKSSQTSCQFLTPRHSLVMLHPSLLKCPEGYMPPSNHYQSFPVSTPSTSKTCVKWLFVFCVPHASFPPLPILPHFHTHQIKNRRKAACSSLVFCRGHALLPPLMSSSATPRPPRPPPVAGEVTLDPLSAKRNSAVAAALALRGDNASSSAHARRSRRCHRPRRRAPRRRFPERSAGPRGVRDGLRP